MSKRRSRTRTVRALTQLPQQMPVWAARAARTPRVFRGNGRKRRTQLRCGESLLPGFSRPAGSTADWEVAFRPGGKDLCPMSSRLHADSLAGMFIGAEIPLEVGFNAAQARLANLADHGLLRRASENAQKWGADQAQIGPGGIPGRSKLVNVQFRHLATHEDSAVWALRWEADGTAGALFPVLDADITLTRAGERGHRAGGVRNLPAATGQRGRRTGPGDHASRRRGDHPGLHETARGRHREPCRLPRGSACRDAARTSPWPEADTA